jgi:ATP-dependent DNA helicase RecQ
MRDYMEHANCLMAFLQAALDDPSPTACGQCRSCNPSLLLNESYDNDLANRAGLFLRRSYQPLPPRKQWPASNMFTQSPLSGYRIPQEQLAEEGRALSLWRDAGWGQLVAHGKYQTNRFADELVAACVEMLQTWSPDPAPQWVTCIPSLNHPELVPDFAARLATALGLPFVPCIEKARANSQQKFMENSYQQVRNLDGAFNINLEPKDYQPCLLVDDMIDSGWTFTVASALLRQVGCSAVYPMALALNSPRMD